MSESGGAPFTVGYLLSDELMFNSRIIGTAKDLGLVVKAARTIADLAALIDQQPPVCVILDLANASLEIAELVSRLRAMAMIPFIVAYGSHVDTAMLRVARDAGCDVVWPRSKFVTELAQALPGWFGVQSGTAAQDLRTRPEA